MASTYKETVCKNYPAFILPRTKLIDGKYLYERRYDCLSFKAYLEANFLNNDFFIGDDNMEQLYQCLATRYKYEKGTIHKYRYFSENGFLSEPSEISIDKLKFFQDEINLDRLDVLAHETYVSEPALVVKVGEDFILFDGYHRTFISLLERKLRITCHIL